MAEVSGGVADTGQEGKSLVGDGKGETLLSWQSVLPEGLRADPTVQKYTSIEQAARALVEQNKLMGRGIYLPEDTATPEAKAEAMARVYEKLGRPKAPGEYEIQKPGDDIPAAFQWDTQFENDFRQEAHAAGLTQPQVQSMVALHQRWVKGLGNQVEARKASSYGEGMAALQKEFGAVTEQRITEATRFFEEFGRGRFGGEKGVSAVEAFKEAILPDGTLLRNVPSVVAAFAEAFGKLSEAPFLTSDIALSGLSNSEALEKKAKELNARFLEGTISSEESRMLRQINEERIRLRERSTAGRR